MSQTTNDYQGGLYALSRAVSQSVVAIQLACTASADKSEAAAPALLEKMRGFYAQLVKPLFEHKKVDEAVERELGTAYGALITHLQAIHAGWQVFRTSNNKHISLDPLSDNFAQQAVQAGKNCHDLAVEAVTRLMREEAQVTCSVELFVALLNQHVETTKRLYKTSPYSQWGYSSLGIYCSLQTRKRLEFQFTYWDNVDAIMVSLGELFPNPEDKLILERFARQAFGGFVQFAEGHSVIELFPVA